MVPTPSPCPSFGTGEKRANETQVSVLTEESNLVLEGSEGLGRDAQNINGFVFRFISNGHDILGGQRSKKSSRTRADWENGRISNRKL